MTWNTETLKWFNSDYNYVLLPINDFSIVKLVIFTADLVNHLNIVDIINTVTTYYSLLLLIHSDIVVGHFFNITNV